MRFIFLTYKCNGIMTCSKGQSGDWTPILLKLHQTFVKLDVVDDDLSRSQAHTNHIHGWSLAIKPTGELDSDR